METRFFKVKQVGTVETFTSSKPTVGTVEKRQLVLQSPGGDYEDAFVASQFGADTRRPLSAGDLVVATLAFMTHDYQGQCYQDVVVRDIVKLSAN